ncbi:MAG: class I SAM-dependent methyltransferase [Planctomycetia bacterium]|jgi:SAM-dependent methyltransferase
MSRSDRRDWQLPPGVVPGTWEYIASRDIADDYDEYFAIHPMFDLDEAVLQRWFTTPGVLIDFGCGTGRALMPFARQNFRCVALDLSLPMLHVVGEKAEMDGLEIDRVCANLVDLDCLADNWADYACCLFSTLGMIDGAENRLAALRGIRKTLKNKGIFVLHVHNAWHHLRYRQGRRRFLRDLPNRLLPGRVSTFGDRTYAYRGLPRMFLHAFSKRELTNLLHQASFTIEETIPLGLPKENRHEPLSRPWLFPRLRAYGWIVVCRTR